LKDHYTVEVFWSDEDKGFIAFVHELEGCSAWGETRETALREVETAIELWIETAREIGRPIPLSSIPRGTR
jgi:predicted RNase H-like HicB family nuclease